ncbi:MAG TPA: 1-deoxy-D-xylulose-5-phosphate reductoisomerase [Gammaproteobacteria bacterium]|nr:1-deoxy-D-xylulose-5-phosphate reductoisomerase [Gammaproteobacteria bacterium]
MIGVAVLGSTGSVGVSTLDVVARHRDRFKVVALTAHRDVDGLLKQCLEHQPKLAVMVDENAAQALAKRLKESGLATEVRVGAGALLEAAALPEARYVMAAIVGAAGLEATLAAVRAGKRVLLANKEALVMAGPLFMDAVRAHGAELIPIDSEHNAVFQCMPGGYHAGAWPRGVRRILLTASGGPFRGWPVERLAEVTPAEACAHPTWSMGRKISVDSATMMNKGLEVIEACWLFGTGPERIEVVVHPQSVIHSMVEYDDGSVLAQLSNPDMRTPIAHGLAWPERLEAGVEPLDILARGNLDFEPPDLESFPCLRLAMQAAEAGDGAPVVLNAANEVGVAAFLEGRLAFTGIADLVATALDEVPRARCISLDDVLALDRRARKTAEARLAALARSA